MTRIFALFAVLVLLTGCAEQIIEGPPVPLGDFKLGHNIVVATKMQQGPVSRTATQEEWVDTVTKAVSNRFGRYDGDQTYHLGISVEAFMLAPPGVPIVYTPRSILVLNVTLWDDKDGRKLNAAPHQVAVFETTGKDSVVFGSGWGRNKQKQMDGLAFNAVEQIETWLLEQSATYGWFTENERVAPADSEEPKFKPESPS
jgi:hypothetical protein